jgi:methylthioribose-1-phosphate isomerase
MDHIEFSNGTLKLLDQTLLPHQSVFVECGTCGQVAEAIKNMVVRGAPAIGIAAAYGMAIAASSINTDQIGEFIKELVTAGDFIKNTRPTAVNLSWAVDRIIARVKENSHLTTDRLKELVLSEAELIHREDVTINKMIGFYGRDLIKDNFTVLTHCNAGALATGGYGTALGVIRAAKEQGKNVMVFADETRPFLQGARLTAWELQRDGIPVTLICDSMAGHFMRLSMVNCVIVGADRIAANGDTANKIGTYSLAVLAHENGIPFYVAAPLSTIDVNAKTGDDIPIEERNPVEVTTISGNLVAPEGISVLNPAFDVTPARYITAIITEKKLVYPPYDFEKLLREL